MRKRFEGGGGVARGGAGRPTDVQLPPTLTVRELAEYLKVSTVDVIKDLIKNGIMKTQNQQIDFDTAAIVADNFGITAAPMVRITWPLWLISCIGTFEHSSGGVSPMRVMPFSSTHL